MKQPETFGKHLENIWKTPGKPLERNRNLHMGSLVIMI
jgi:hypothetical protein